MKQPTKNEFTNRSLNSENYVWNPDTSNYEPITDFQYETETTNEIEQYKQELLVRLLQILCDSKSPVNTLASFILCSGIDTTYLYNCENKLSPIARAIDTSRQNLHKHKKRMLRKLKDWK